MMTGVMASTPRAAPAGDGPDIAGAIHLIRDLVGRSAPDCECLEKVDEALRQLETLERTRGLMRQLAAAREERRKIGLLLDMLMDLADEDALDAGVIESASLVFADIAASAQEGARILRGIAAAGTSS